MTVRGSARSLRMSGRHVALAIVRLGQAQHGPVDQRRLCATGCTMDGDAPPGVIEFLGGDPMCVADQVG